MFDRVAGTDGNWTLDGTFSAIRYQDRFRELPDTRLVWVKADKETCIERNDAQEDDIADVGVYTMYGKFEEPEADLVLDTDKLSLEETGTKLVATVLDWVDAA